MNNSVYRIMTMKMMLKMKGDAFYSIHLHCCVLLFAFFAPSLSLSRPVCVRVCLLLFNGRFVWWRAWANKQCCTMNAHAPISVQFLNVYECDTLINAFVQKIFSTIVDKLSVCLCVSVRRAHTTENREICEKNPQQKQPNDIKLHILWKTAG